MANLTAEKVAAARASLDHVEPGMRLGLGSGSTAEILVSELGERVRAGLRVSAVVPTSEKTGTLARAQGLPVVTLDDVDALDVCIDGADEVDPSLNLLKGGGGAHLREKVVASASHKRVIIVDSSKPVPHLGPFGLPVEVIPFAAAVVHRAIERIGGRPTLRKRNGGTFVTDEGNHIFDCDFGLITDPPTLAGQLAHIAGVVEHGLFCGMAEVVIVGRGEEVEVLTPQAGR